MGGMVIRLKQNMLDTGPKSGVLGYIPVNVRGFT